MFVDECTIEVIAGKGGDGCVSFRREKYVPRGGPDGGDGGDGGDVRLRVSPHLRTLSHLRHSPTFRASAGHAGMGKQMTGGRGADVVVMVPPGTEIVDEDSGEWIADTVEPGAEIVLARGGHGGRGNVRFKGAERRTPRFAEPGTPGEKRRLHLTLKLLADVGLVGLPNAGKSTLLARVSHARPKVADYPFTTLEPVLGIVSVGEYDTLVLADLPGLIEGAHAGRGLGQRFLRHVERTRALLIMIEATDPDPSATLATLRAELAQWSQALGERQRLICYTKADLLTPEAREALPPLEGGRPLMISAATGEGIDELLRGLREMVLAVEGGVRESAEQERVPEAVVDRTAGPPVQPIAGAVLDRSNEEAFDWRAAFGERPWPTRWVIPRRAGARLPESAGAEETRSGRKDE